VRAHGDRYERAQDFRTGICPFDERRDRESQDGAVQVSKLAKKGDVELQRAAWKKALEKLREILSS
jgi:hypothetical protein